MVFFMQMADDIDEIIRVLKMYHKIGNMTSDFKSIHSPVYTTLSKELKMQKRKIYQIIRSQQPYVPLKRYTCIFDLNIIWN